MTELRPDDLSPFIIPESMHGGSATQAYKSIVEFYHKVIVWYLSEKERKGRWSKRLRISGIVLGVLGGVAPLISITYPTLPSPTGYILLALAGGLQLVDRYFGYSTAWSRYLSAAMEANGLLLMLQLRWMELAAKAPVDDGKIEFWALLKEFGVRLASVVNEETTRWSSEFSAGLLAFEARLSSPHHHSDSKI